ncbi:MAG: DUF5984 family protein [Limnohabitans sp.]|nr:DUF5984 family protein [Limnohabitans sp.]
MIHFKLKPFQEIQPVGNEPYLSWFWLTDGDLWLQIGDHTIYEYTPEAVQYFDHKPSAYNDYYIVRFLEDFTELFKYIGSSIPKKFYDFTANIEQFEENTQKWLDIYDIDEEEYPDFYFNEYDQIRSWTYERKLTSGYLKGGPHLSFYRHKDKIRIIWKTEYTLENGTQLWTAKNGSHEMLFQDFVDKVDQFGQQFFLAMDKQIEGVVQYDWKDVSVDKPRLEEEHQERKVAFQENLEYLKNPSNDDVNWISLDNLYSRMLEELK